MGPRFEQLPLFLSPIIRSICARRDLAVCNLLKRPAFSALFLLLGDLNDIWLNKDLLPYSAALLSICKMGRKGLLGCALHLFSIALSLVLKPPQSLPEATANTPIALDASYNSSAIQIAPIPSENTQSDQTSSVSLANITASADNATLTQMVVNCNGAPFTRPGPASYSSCQDAFEYTRSGVNVMTFGDRASGDWNVALPVRFMSGKRAPSSLGSQLDLVGYRYSS